MAKLKIEVLGAVVDGKKRGEQLEVEEKSAKHLISIGYAKEVKVVAKPAPKPRTATKK